jgi:uncharacterized protein
MLDQYREGIETITMSQRDPNLVTSSLSGVVSQDGVKVEVCIVRLEHEKLWTLEVVNAAGTSVVWDEQFSSDEEAYAEFKKTISAEGMQAFVDQGNVIPFKR